MSTDGVHASVKAIQDMEAACARFSRAVVDRLPEIERELRQVSEELDDRRSQLRREIADLEEQISSADEDDDKSWERQRADDAEDELASVTRRIRRFDEVSGHYARQARQAENLATDYTVRMREFLIGSVDDIKAYLVKGMSDAVAVSLHSPISYAPQGTTTQGSGSENTIPVNGLTATTGVQVTTLNLDKMAEAVSAAADSQVAHAIMALPLSERGLLKIAPDDNVRFQAGEAKAFISSVLHASLVPENECKIEMVYDRGYYDHRTSTAFVRPDAVRCTVHELAHYIERHNPKILAACRDFLQSRVRPGELPQRLDRLTGDFRYEPHEIAIEDEWAARGGDVYCGRFYGQSIAGAIGTEILSMGLERLYKAPIGFARDDSQYFNFILSILRS